MTCPRCGCVFCPQPTGFPQVYCSPQCKRAAKERRSRSPRHQRRQLQRCQARKQAKMRFATETEARRVAATILQRPLIPYECPCGGWHLTTKPRDEETVP